MDVDSVISPARSRSPRATPAPLLDLDPRIEVLPMQEKPIEGGILVTDVAEFSPLFDLVKPLDVLLRVGGYAIGENATVEIRPGERTNWKHALTTGRNVGDSVDLQWMRQGGWRGMFPGFFSRVGGISVAGGCGRGDFFFGVWQNGSVGFKMVVVCGWYGQPGFSVGREEALAVDELCPTSRQCLARAIRFCFVDGSQKRRSIVDPYFLRFANMLCFSPLAFFSVFADIIRQSQRKRINGNAKGFHFQNDSIPTV